MNYIHDDAGLSKRMELSSLEFGRSDVAQAKPYTHACWNLLLYAERQRGSLDRMWGEQNTQLTAGIFRNWLG